MAGGGTRLSLLRDRQALAPSLIVPDEQTWTMLGNDPAGFGAVPSFRAGATVALLLPERIPEELRAAMTDYLGELTGTEAITIQDLEVPGSVLVSQLIDGPQASGAEPGSGPRPEDKDAGDPGGDPGRDDAMHDMGDMHETGEMGGMHEMGDTGGGQDMDDMHDMMAIVGEPSADGLVMETIQVIYGPLAVPFPGGLTVKATLDGDVVTEVTVSGLTETEASTTDPPAGPDPLAPIAWASCIGLASGTGGSGPSILFGVEHERAVSHLAWLRTFSRLLGWNRMVRLATATLAELTAIDPGSLSIGETDLAARGHLESVGARVDDVLDLLQENRLLNWRLGGRGVLPPERAGELGLDGPNSRASGLRRDRRIGNPVYETLGFEPLLERDGDAAARTLLRAREAAQSIELIRSALDPGGGQLQVVDPGASPIEGPRGVISAERTGTQWRLLVPGADGARALAAELMVGESWENALTILASFDLSPWGDGR